MKWRECEWRYDQNCWRNKYPRETSTEKETNQTDTYRYREWNLRIKRWKISITLCVFFCNPSFLLFDVCLWTLNEYWSQRTPSMLMTKSLWSIVGTHLGCNDEFSLIKCVDIFYISTWFFIVLHLLSRFCYAKATQIHLWVQKERTFFGWYFLVDILLAVYFFCRKKVWSKSSASYNQEKRCERNTRSFQTHFSKPKYKKTTITTTTL